MAVMEIFARLRRLLKLEITVAYVHHGRGSKAQMAYRDRAEKLVSKWAAKHELRFVTNSDRSVRLKTEAEFRDWRWSWLKRWQREFGAVVVTAHHAGDLLETRLMRLIRGTGAQGFTSMRYFQPDRQILRPVLMLEKQDLFNYAKSVKLKFVNDPSNKKTDVFRNWTRRWITVLDKRHPGGSRNLAAGLNQLAEELVSLERSQDETVLTNGAIDRLIYLRIDRASKKASLARYCFELGMKNYTQGHVEELLKRLDDPKNAYTFEMLRHNWSVTPDRIRATRLRIPPERGTL